MFPFSLFQKRRRKAGKPKLILHIGVGKTGTSALQQFFEQNEKALLHHGICYPSFGRICSAHHRLSHLVPAPLKPQIAPISSSVWAEKLARQPYDTFLISTELMHIITKEEIKEYLTPVMEHFNVYIALYLRRQDEALLSGYNQGIKTSLRVISFNSYLKNAAQKVDYKEKINLWASMVGHHHILPALYDKTQFADNDLRKDFLKRILHIEDFTHFHFPQNEKIINERLTNDAASIKRVLNHLPLPVENIRDLEKAFLAWSKACPAPHDFWPILSDMEQDAIMERFADSNHEIALRYFPHVEGNLFFPRKIIENVYDNTMYMERVPSFATFLAEGFPNIPPVLLSHYNRLAEQERPENLRLVMEHIAQSPEGKENLSCIAKSR